MLVKGDVLDSQLKWKLLVNKELSYVLLIVGKIICFFLLSANYFFPVHQVV